MLLQMLYIYIANVICILCYYVLQVPCGLFIPSLAMGGITGRIVGILMQQLAAKHPHLWFFDNSCGLPGQEGCITPGLYAMVGAAAVLGGVTRMTGNNIILLNVNY